MFGSVFAKSLYDQRRGFLGWSIGLVLTMATMMAVWPTMRDMPDLDQFLANYPEALKELFNVEGITTGAGFLNAELFSMILPILFLIFGISRGAKLLAGDEEAGTLEVVLATPVPRLRLVLEQAAALVLTVVGLGVVLFVVTAGLAPLVDMDIPVSEVAGACTAMVVLGILNGLLALGIGAVTGRRALALGVAASTAVATYLLYIVGQLVDAVEPWKAASPFYHALEHGPIGGGWPPAYGILALIGVGLLGTALPRFHHRDIGV
jgi:ABC-2 type transport system permease protein